MKTFIKILLIFFLISAVVCSTAQEERYSIKIRLGVKENVRDQFKPDGRLFMMMGKDPKTYLRRPRIGMYQRSVFAKNIKGWDANESLNITSAEGWDVHQPASFRLTEHPEKGWYVSPEFSFDAMPEGKYFIQFIWDQDNVRHQINAPGNVYSWRKELDLKCDTFFGMAFTDIFSDDRITKHELIKEVNLKSIRLSEWWGKSVYQKASVLLPSNYYNNPDKEYPILYDIAGANGRYYRINKYIKNKKFWEWWSSDEAPQIIVVFLDGYGPFGDCYQLNSENNGPYGTSLIEELIPHIELKYRNTQTPLTRMVTGCSTGGWVSLALSIFYAEHFNGCISYAPDPLSFKDYLTIDLYESKNMFVNKYGNPCFMKRNIFGHSMVSWEEFIDFESVLSADGTYLTSGWPVGMMNAVYSPKGKDGLPMPIIDQETGKINKEVAEHWRKWDLVEHLSNKWDDLGRKLQGKIYVQVSDNDNYFLNYGVREMDKFLQTTESPKSDAVIEYTSMKSHCEGANIQDKIERAAKRLDAIYKEHWENPISGGIPID